MMTPVYIYENELGITCFDRYFEYLKSIEADMPDPLKKFAMDPGRYELNGPRTLHDAWLCALRVDKEHDVSQQLVKTSVPLELQLAVGQMPLCLRYLDGSAIQTQLIPDRWPARPVDLLFHEISRVDQCRFRHIFIFDRGVKIDISFDAIEITEFHAELK